MEEQQKLPEEQHTEQTTSYEHQQAQQLEKETKTIGTKIKEHTKTGKARLYQFYLECKRVLRVTKKPDKEEYRTIAKVVAVGMAVLGLVGFLVHFAKELLL